MPKFAHNFIKSHFYNAFTAFAFFILLFEAASLPAQESETVEINYSRNDLIADELLTKLKGNPNRRLNFSTGSVLAKKKTHYEVIFKGSRRQTSFRDDGCVFKTPVLPHFPKGPGRLQVFADVQIEGIYQSQSQKTFENHLNYSLLELRLQAANWNEPEILRFLLKDLEQRSIQMRAASTAETATQARRFHSTKDASPLIDLALTEAPENLQLRYCGIGFIKLYNGISVRFGGVRLTWDPQA